MSSPSAASENVVVYCAILRGALSVSLYVKHQMHPPPPGHVSHSVCFTCCSQAAVHWSARTIQRSAKVTRPCMERIGLQPARYIEAAAYCTLLRYRDMKCHDRSISLLGYDMITRPSPPPKFSAHVYYSYCDFVRTLHRPKALLVSSSSS